MPLTRDDIKVGRVYSAKREKVYGFMEPLIGDRQVLWMSQDKERVQYDSPSVKIGQKRPVVPIDTFVRWAKEDITEEMPKGEWRNKRNEKK